MTEHTRSVQLAHKIWPRLMILAETRSIISYQDLGKDYGIQGRALQGFSTILAPIKYYCLQHGLPQLSALVVLKGTSLPGTGAEADENDISQVWTYNWRSRSPLIPSEADLAAALAQSEAE